MTDELFNHMTGDLDFDELLNRCTKILVIKGKDYTIGSSDLLTNFKTIGSQLGLDPLMVLAVYARKHMDGFIAYCKGRTESEPIEDRLADIINYCLLAYKMIKEQRKTNG